MHVSLVPPQKAATFFQEHILAEIRIHYDLKRKVKKHPYTQPKHFLHKLPNFQAAVLHGEA